jgi:octaprenyl-diphosphate synthase
MTTTVPTLNDIYGPVADELHEVRAIMRGEWTEVLGLVQGTAPPSDEVTGKLLRPALVLLAAGALDSRNVGRFTPLAAAIEMFHLAALAHDDVIDAADMRRGVRSLNNIWDDHAAVLGGDYLVGRGISVMTSFDSSELVRSAVDCICDMAKGELRTFRKGAEDLKEDDCIALASAKTAALFGLAATAPSFLIPNRSRELLGAYGLNLGVAFQLIDDLLDLCQSEEALGKPACGDVAEGKVTLPILLMRGALAEPGVARLDAMRGQNLDEADRTWVATRFRETGAQQETEARARHYAGEARSALAELPGGPFKDALQNLCEFVVVRGS